MPELIKFTDENIAAIRGGLKSQTRRPIKGQPLVSGQYRVADVDGEPTDLLIEVTDILAERLHDINVHDCRLEGIREPTLYRLHAFKTIWSSIYGPENQFAWQNNPWVWVYTFRVVE